MKNKSLFYFFIAMALGAVFLAYSNHFHNSFHFDDSHTIQNNLYIRDLRNIPSFFRDASMFSSLPDHQAYRPLLTTLNAIEYHWGDGDPFYFHIFSFSFYLFICVIYYFILRRIFNFALPLAGNDFLALIVTVFYSVHPANAETVNYISATSDLLSTLMAMAAFLVYMYGKQYRRFFIYLIPFILGFLVKPTVAIFPLLLFFYVLLFEKDNPWLETVPAWITSGLMLALSAAMTPKTFVPSHMTRWEYVLTQPEALLHYFINFFVPLGLCADFEFQPMQGIFDERVIVGCFFIIIMIALAIKTSREHKTRPIAFGIAWFFITSIPTSCGAVSLSESMNDHRMFFPLLGLMMAVGWGMKLFLDKCQVMGRYSRLLKWAVFLLLLIIFAGYVYGTYQRNKVWKDEGSLWYEVTVKRPQNGRGLMNYGLTRMAKGDYRTARAYFERALIYDPQYSTLYVNLGIVQNAMGDPVSAQGSFLKALALDPVSPYSYYFYARYLDQHHRDMQAAGLLKACLEHSPGYLDCRDLLKRINAGF